MDNIKKVILVFFLLISSACAQHLEIKIDEHSVTVPYWPAKTAHYGAVLMVRGGDPGQWSPLLAGFAKELANNGWSVVLLNCDQDDSLPWITQVPAVIRVLRQDKNRRIVLVHYGEQLNQLLDYFTQPQAKMINGLVLLSAYDLQKEGTIPLELRFPVFDIIGQFDYEPVRRQMELREQESQHHGYLALEMPGANHDYEYSRSLLFAFVHGWMAKLPEFKPQPPPVLLSYIEPVAFLTSYIAAIDGTNWTILLNNS